MAKSVKQWYDIIIAEKESQATLNGLLPNPDSSQTFLDDLKSESKVSIWRLWAWVVAVVCNVLETIWEQFEARMQAIADAAEPPNESWCHKKMLEYQEGYSLVIIDGVPQYQTIDESARSIKLAAVVGSPGLVTFKVAKLQGNNPQALTTPEKLSVKAYLNDSLPPDMSFQVASQNADLMKVIAEIFYDAQLVEADVLAAIEAADLQFRVDLNLNSFNGVIDVNKWVDHIQKATGYLTIRIDSFEAKAWNGSYQTVNPEYQTVAGYVQIDPAFPLANTLTLTPR